jgi:hypothetical protein
MCHRIGPWNQVGFRVKADLPSGPAANDLERLTHSRSFFDRLANETPIQFPDQRSLKATPHGGGTRPTPPCRHSGR